MSTNKQVGTLADLPEITKSMTVGQYVMARLSKLGVTHTFGVPGDFVYDVCDAIEDSPDIQGIWCANELNASHAAEGYARTKGVGVMVMTYGPGELSTYTGLGGAHGENGKVVSLTGMPGLNEHSPETRTHHMSRYLKLRAADRGLASVARNF